jgi:heme-degrading monooxygenase HmoA
VRIRSYTGTNKRDIDGKETKLKQEADERELINRIERVPAAPDRIVEMQDYTLQPGSEDVFEALWRDFAAELSHQPGCILLRLHRDIEKPSHYVSYGLWESRRTLVDSIRSMPEAPAYPISGEPHLTYVRAVIHVWGSQLNSNHAAPGQIASLRGFYLKVQSEPHFEQLWRTSARAEAHQQGCLYKRLHRDLNLPTHYVSYSLWADSDAPEQAASKHADWQGQYEPYPLASSVVRMMLEVRGNYIGNIR